MLSHLNILCGMASEEFLGFNFSKNDVYLSYVPLTHVYEQIDHCVALSNGFRIGYSSGNPKELINDVQKLKPTFFGSFPAFFNKIHEQTYLKIKD